MGRTPPAAIARPERRPGLVRLVRLSAPGQPGSAGGAAPWRRGIRVQHPGARGRSSRAVAEHPGRRAEDQPAAGPSTDRQPRPLAHHGQPDRPPARQSVVGHADQHRGGVAPATRRAGRGTRDGPAVAGSRAGRSGRAGLVAGAARVRAALGPAPRCPGRPARPAAAGHRTPTGDRRRPAGRDRTPVRQRSHLRRAPLRAARRAVPARHPGRPAGARRRMRRRARRRAADRRRAGRGAARPAAAGGATAPRARRGPEPRAQIRPCRRERRRRRAGVRAGRHPRAVVHRGPGPGSRRLVCGGGPALGPPAGATAAAGHGGRGRHPRPAGDLGERRRPADHRLAGDVDGGAARHPRCHHHAPDQSRRAATDPADQRLARPLPRRLRLDAVPGAGVAGRAGGHHPGRFGAPGAGRPGPGDHLLRSRAGGRHPRLHPQPDGRDRARCSPIPAAAPPSRSTCWRRGPSSAAPPDPAAGTWWY